MNKKGLKVSPVICFFITNLASPSHLSSLLGWRGEATDSRVISMHGDPPVSYHYHGVLALHGFLPSLAW
jgi:hypothetical protein